MDEVQKAARRAHSSTYSPASEEWHPTEQAAGARVQSLVLQGEAAEDAQQVLRDKNRQWQRQRRERYRNTEKELKQRIAAMQKKLHDSTTRWRQLRQQRHNLLLRPQPAAQQHAALQSTSATASASQPSTVAALSTPPLQASTHMRASLPASTVSTHSALLPTPVATTTTPVSLTSSSLFWQVHSAAPQLDLPPQQNHNTTARTLPMHAPQQCMGTSAPRVPLAEQLLEAAHVQAQRCAVLQRGRKRGAVGCLFREPYSTKAAVVAPSHRVVVPPRTLLLNLGDIWHNPGEAIGQHGVVLVAAVKTHQAEVAQRFGVAVDAVNWCFELPLRTSGNDSLTIRGFSPFDVEGVLTASLWYQLRGFEVMFLVREHELLQASACPGSRLPVHTYLQPRSMAPPEPPSAAALSGMHLTVGIDGLYPLAKAVEEILGSMLRKYREFLPHTTWYTICMHCMHVVEDTVVSMGVASAGSADVPQQSLQCVKVLLQQILCVLHSEMHAPKAVQQSGGRTMLEVRSLLVEQVGVLSCYFAHLMLLRPHESRIALLQPVQSHHMTVARQQRMVMRLLRLLQLSNTQKNELAARWRSWHRRRSALSLKLAAALKLLEKNLPQCHTLPPMLVHVVDVVCKLGITPGLLSHAQQQSTGAQRAAWMRGEGMAGASSNEQGCTIHAGAPVDTGSGDELMSDVQTVFSTGGEAGKLSKEYLRGGGLGIFGVAVREEEALHEQECAGKLLPKLPQNVPQERGHIFIQSCNPQQPVHPDGAAHWQEARASCPLRPHTHARHASQSSSDISCFTEGRLCQPVETAAHACAPAVTTFLEACASRTRLPEESSKQECHRRFSGFLGERLKHVEKIQEAMDDIWDVHKGDELMFGELAPPYPPLNEVQHGMLAAAQVEIGHPGPHIMHVCKVVAQSLASDALFHDALSIDPLMILEPAPKGNTQHVSSLPRSVGPRANPTLGLL